MSAASFARRAVSAVRWRVAMRLYRAGRFRMRELLRAGDPEGVAVIMCLWNRRERIDAVLTQLDAQQGTRVRLLLWNNKPSDDAYYRERIAAYRPHGALASVSLFSSPVNVGGLGRFFAARQLWVAGERGTFVMLDDDNRIADIPEMLEGRQQARIVALVQADRRLVQNVEHAGQTRTDLRGEADALRFTARKRTGGAR